MLVNMLTGKGIMTAGKRFMREGRGYNNMDHIDKNLVPLHPGSNIKITKYFNYKPRFNGVSSKDNLPRIKDGPHVITTDIIRKIKVDSMLILRRYCKMKILTNFRVVLRYFFDVMSMGERSKSW